jgi:hypothetical protein
MVGWLIPVPFSSPGIIKSPSLNAALFFIGSVALTIIGTAVFAMTIYAAFRMLGGRAAFIKYFIYCNYLSSVAVIIILMFLLFGLSIIMMVDIDVYRNALKPGGLSKEALGSLSWGVKVAIISSVVADVLGVVCAFIWFVTAWGVFGAANNFTAGRSTAAFFVALVLAIPVLAASLVMGIGIGHNLERLQSLQ